MIKLDECTKEQHEKYMSVALDEANLAYLKDEIPIGAVMVRNGEIIAKAHNLRNSTKDPLKHAEMDIIRQSAEIVGDWRLEDCTLYVTIEPCPMCSGAIVQARIPRTVYGAKNPKAGGDGSVLNILRNLELNHQVEVIEGILENECRDMMRKFFRRFRKDGKYGNE